MAFRNGTDKTKGWSSSHCQTTSLSLITVYFESKCTGITKLFSFIFIFWKIRTRTVARIFCVGKRNYGEDSEAAIFSTKKANERHRSPLLEVLSLPVLCFLGVLPSKVYIWEDSGRGILMCSPRLPSHTGGCCPLWCYSPLGTAPRRPMLLEPSGSQSCRAHCSGSISLFLLL